MSNYEGISREQVRRACELVEQRLLQPGQLWNVQIHLGLGGVGLLMEGEGPPGRYWSERAAVAGKPETAPVPVTLDELRRLVALLQALEELYRTPRLMNAVKTAIGDQLTELRPVVRRHGLAYGVLFADHNATLKAIDEKMGEEPATR